RVCCGSRCAGSRRRAWRCCSPTWRGGGSSDAPRWVSAGPRWVGSRGGGIDGAMRILVIGSGGREHALAWRLARTGDQIVAAAGKGVAVGRDTGEARAAARAMLEARRFGDAGATVVIEHRIVGREVSVLALTDGARLEVLPAVEDHKTIFDADRGPNTGGMGT